MLTAGFPACLLAGLYQQKKAHANLLAATRNQAGRPMGPPVEILPWLGLGVGVGWAGLT